MRSALLSLALALPLPLYTAWAAGRTQDPAPRERETQEPQEPQEPDAETDDAGADPFGRRSRSGPRGRLQGCWKLKDIQLAGLPTRGRTAVGALLVHEDFLALELHLAWADDPEAPTMKQSFIAEYALERGRELQVKSLVGSYLDQNMGGVDWARFNFVRDYEFQVAGNRLVLTFGQGNEMTFQRQHAQAQQSRDIFGRERDGEVVARDIFGRPVKRDEDTERENEPAPSVRPPRDGAPR